MYNNFGVLNNRVPTKQYIANVVPDYVNLTYSCIIQTYYVEQLNKIIEAINYASDSYWGNPERFKFKALIDSFATITELQASAEKQAQQTQDLAAKLAAAETSNRKIASMLAQTDIVKNSLVDPTGVEVRINEEVDLFFNELQSLTSD